ncbi:MAG: phosphatase PAP2 family protein [Ruminococcaceae bacterium]|nr:phosphatase PAP2 family protein [Oscillospiraceae bacterium]
MVKYEKDNFRKENNMEILRLFEAIRNPVLDTFFFLVTRLGEETLFILIGILFFWCINKKEGYYLLSVGLMGTVINQFLKLLFRVPRPWVRDPDFTIVESARAEATGYSFPSGHTQTAVGSFGAVARWHKEKVIRIICIVLCVLVPVSRMYLGVHTPADVIVSIIVALALVFGMYPFVRRSTENHNYMRILFGIMLAISVGYLLFVNLFNFPADIDPHNFESGMKNAYTMLGCISALWLTFEVETRYINFKTEAPWWGQIIKVALGFGILVGIKSGLKAPLHALMENTYLADGIRYFLMTVFAGILWPLTFRLFDRVKK